MDFLDFPSIINAAIGSFIGRVIAAFVLSLPLIPWIKNIVSRIGWEKLNKVLSPILFIIIWLLLLVFLSYINEYFESKAPSFTFTCNKECVQHELKAINECTYVGNMYANPESRIDVYKDPKLRSMLPTYPPEPKRLYRGAKESNFPTFVRELAEKTFFMCMYEMGFSPTDCVEGKLCFQIRSTTFYSPNKTIYEQGVKFRNGITVILLDVPAKIDNSD